VPIGEFSWSELTLFLAILINNYNFLNGVLGFWGLVRTTKIAKPVRIEAQPEPNTKQEKTQPVKINTSTGNQIDSDPHIHGTRQYIGARVRGIQL